MSTAFTLESECDKNTAAVWWVSKGILVMPQKKSWRKVGSDVTFILKVAFENHIKTESCDRILFKYVAIVEIQNIRLYILGTF